MYIVHWGRRLLPTDMKLHFNYLYIFCSAVLIFTIHHAESDALEPQNSVFKAFFFLQQSSRRRPEPLEGVWTFHITFPGGRNWRFLLNKNMLSKALKTTKPRLQQPGWKHILFDSSQWQNIGSSKVVVKAFSRDLFKTFFKCWNLGLRR